MPVSLSKGFAAVDGFDQRAIVTGSTGLVGAVLVARLTGRCSRLHLGAADWREQIGRADFRDATVFHLAARVHAPRSSLEACLTDNLDKTRALAEAAAQGGARRFVFLSSVKVNGEESHSRPFRTADAAAPVDAYAKSKWAAEEALRDVAARSGLVATVVRSPLVIGANARGNLEALLRLADTAWPLPFGSIDNRRTMVCADDLASLLCRCALSSRAEGRMYFAGHEEAISTRRLVACMRRALGRPERLFPTPPAMLELAATGLGQRDAIRRLTRSLEVDLSETWRDLGWRATTPVEEAIAQMSRAHGDRA